MWKQFVFVHDWDHTNYLIPKETENDFYNERDILVNWDYMVVDCHTFDNKRDQYKMRPDEIIINDYDEK